MSVCLCGNAEIRSPLKNTRCCCGFIQVRICWNGHRSGAISPLAAHPDLYFIGVTVSLLSWKMIRARPNGTGKDALYQVYFMPLGFTTNTSFIVLSGTKQSVTENLSLPFRLNAQ